MTRALTGEGVFRPGGVLRNSILSVLFCFNGCLTCFAVLGLGGVF